jgi:hypothetical protein
MKISGDLQWSQCLTKKKKIGASSPEMGTTPPLREEDFFFVLRVLFLFCFCLLFYVLGFV